MIVPRQPQSSSDVAGHYDELDRVYRDIWGEHVHHGLWTTGRESSAEAADALSDFVAARLEPQAGEQLGDIGCGYGKTAARFAERYGVGVTGLTLSAEQAKVAAARPGRLDFHVRDWQANGLPDASFDRAYAIESTEHMADKQRVFDEAARTLRPGGRFVVCAWLAADAPRRWEIEHLLEPICREGRLPGIAMQGEYLEFAERAGFTLLRYDDISRQVARTWRICITRLLRKLASDAAYRRMLLDPGMRNRVFILTLPRLMLAYRTGAMRYGVFTFERG